MAGRDWSGAVEVLKFRVLEAECGWFRETGCGAVR